jgi:hypothetical protein
MVAGEVGPTRRACELVSGGARMLMWSFLLPLVGTAASAPFILWIWSQIPYLMIYGGHGPLWTLGGAMAATDLISLAFAAASLALQWIGWSRLRDADRHRYGIGRTGLVLEVIGLILVIAVFIPISVAISAAGPQPWALGLAGAGAVALGGILELAGFIMVLVGLWRLDEDHGVGYIKASIATLIATVIVAVAGFAYWASWVAGTYMNPASGAFVPPPAAAPLAPLMDLMAVLLALDIVIYALLIVGLRRVSAVACARSQGPPPAQ